MSDPRDHVISVVLSDEEWKAFVSRQPQPVAWLRERISELIAATSATPQVQVGAAYTRSAISR
jgi:hypothetical protein